MHDTVLVAPDPRYRLAGAYDVFGFERVCTLLDESAALSALRTIVETAADETASVTPLVALLARWLKEAGLEEVEKATGLGRGFSSSTGEPLLLSRGDYTGDYLLRRIDRRAPFANRWIWKLGGAINRFYHTGRALGGIVDGAVERRCATLDERLVSCERLLRQVATGEASESEPSGEWEARRRLAALVKTLVVPLGFRANFQLDLSSGLLCWGFVSSNEEEIPPLHFDDDERWVRRTFEERVSFAHTLAERIGATLALGAVRAIPSLKEVTLAAFPHSDGDDELSQTTGAEFPKTARDPFFEVTLTGEAFETLRRRGADESFDVHRFLLDAGATTGADVVNPYRALRATPVDALRMELPEAGEVTFTADQAEALGCQDSSALRISADGIVRHAAVSLARLVAEAASHQEAIAAVREVQRSSTDPRVYAGCNRLMEALLRDGFDRADQNLIVFTMMPDDPCETANIRFEGALRSALGDQRRLDPALLDMLLDAVGSSLREDSAEVVYRTFETYAQRILYNLDRLDPEHPDAGRSVELAPVSLGYSLLNIAQFYAGMSGSEEAVRWAYRAIALAPTDPHIASIAGQTAAKAGEMEVAREMYECALSWAASPHEAADVYMQLGAVLWQAGENELGSACLEKAGALSPLIASKAMATEWSLAKATGRFPVGYQRVDGLLADAGLGQSPDEGVIEDLDGAVKALVDANIFRAALDVMGPSVRAHPRPVEWALYCSLYRAPGFEVTEPW